jgi:hypothetical protein
MKDCLRLLFSLVVDIIDRNIQSKRKFVFDAINIHCSCRACVVFLSIDCSRFAAAEDDAWGMGTVYAHGYAWRSFVSLNLAVGRWISFVLLFGRSVARMLKSLSDRPK